MKIIQFGEKVSGYEIPVLNEREIRAAAGMYFLLMFIAINQIVIRWDFTPLKYAITIFLVDFLIRVFVNPKFSPTLILGRLIVRNQTPEYVGAQQKKFAWIFGVVLATTMFFSLVVFNYHSPVNALICFICLIFLFFESVFGICLGCKFYPLIYGKKAQYCPGEVCEPKNRQAIQKTGRAQLLTLLTFIAVLTLAGVAFKDHFALKPVLGMGMEVPPQFR